MTDSVARSVTEGFVQTPIGALLVRWTAAGVRMVRFAEDGEELGPPAPEHIASAVLAGRGAGADLSSCTPFQREVLERTATIPPGEVRTYGWVARELGKPGAVRAVGTVLRTNPVPVLVPCHRVVRSDLRLGRYALGNDGKRALLAAEGADLDQLEAYAESRVRLVARGADSGVLCLPSCRAGVGDGPGVPIRSVAAGLAAGHQLCPHCRPDSGA